MDRSQLGKGMMELVGTAVLLMTIEIAVANAGNLAGIAIGVVLICIVYAGGHISGAQYNPAVSLAIMLRGKMTLHEMLQYWIFQIAGGVIGAILGGTIAGNFAMIGVGAGFTGTQAFLAEVVYTFLLCFVVLSVATHSGVDGSNSYYGAAIGMVVMVGAISAGPISGGAFNPAVALGLCIANGVTDVAYVISTIGANLLGGAAAAAVFWVVAPDQFIKATEGETRPLV